MKAHVSLNVRDVEASAAFYGKLFGVPPLKRRPGYAKFDLAEPSLNLTMQQLPPTGLNASHFGIQVGSTAEVLAAKARLEASGLATRAEEQTTCCYAVQDKVWVQDPDGNEWEVFVVLEDAERMHGEGPGSDRAACCVTEVPESCATPVACAATPAGGSCGCGA